MADIFSCKQRHPHMHQQALADNLPYKLAASTLIMHVQQAEAPSTPELITYATCQRSTSAIFCSAHLHLLVPYCHALCVLHHLVHVLHLILLLLKQLVGAAQRGIVCLSTHHLRLCGWGLQE
jgi:hypothetical protein